MNTQTTARSGFYIGAGQDDPNNTPDTYADGMGWQPTADIHDFRYYGRALSTSEIREVYDTERLIGDESIRLLYEEDPQTYSGKLATPDSPMPPYEILVKNLRKLFIESNQPMLHLDFANMDVSLNQYVNKGLLTDTIINNNDSVKREETEILPQMAGDTEWKLVTKLEKGRPMNNPWTGTGEQGAPIVELPLHTLSDNNGTDLEIKIEADLDYDDDQWELSTELTQGSQCNNPWTGEPRVREHYFVFDDTKLHNSTVTYYPH